MTRTCPVSLLFQWRFPSCTPRSAPSVTQRHRTMVSGPSYLYLKNDQSSIFEYENTSITAILICLDAFNFKLLLNTCMIPNIVSEKKLYIMKNTFMKNTCQSTCLIGWQVFLPQERVIQNEPNFTPIKLVKTGFYIGPQFGANPTNGRFVPILSVNCFIVVVSLFISESSPFLSSIQESLSRLLLQMPSKYTFTELMDKWVKLYILTNFCNY